jgi:hypothetical protein
MARKNSANYDSGKAQEKEADAFIRTQGYERPTAKQRKVIKEALYQTKSLEINTTGFDLVASEILPFCNDVSDLMDCIIQNEMGNKVFPDLILYEMKSAGSKRKSKVSEDWKNFGFTYSQNEDDNWVELGDDGYKFIFVDMTCSPPRYRVLNRAEWNNEENCRSYTTKSIFIKNL